MKPWWKSKTLWFNAIVSGLATMEATASVLQPYVQGNIYALGIAVLAVGNAVLRVFSAARLTAGN